MTNSNDCINWYYFESNYGFSLSLFFISVKRMRYSPINIIRTCYNHLSYAHTSYILLIVSMTPSLIHIMRINHDYIYVTCIQSIASSRSIYSITICMLTLSLILSQSICYVLFLLFVLLFRSAVRFYIIFSLFIFLSLLLTVKYSLILTLSVRPYIWLLIFLIFIAYLQWNSRLLQPWTKLECFDVVRVNEKR